MQNVDTEFSLGGREGPTSFISEEDENGSMKKNLKGTGPDLRGSNVPDGCQRLCSARCDS